MGCSVIILADNYNRATTPTTKSRRHKGRLNRFGTGLQRCDPCGLPGAAPGSRSTVVSARLRARGCGQVCPEQAAMVLGRAGLAGRRSSPGGWTRCHLKDLGGYVLPNLDLRACACSFLSILEKLGCNLFIDICLSAVGADLSRYAFYNHS